MESYSITTANGLHELFLSLGNLMYFRGVTNSEFSLIPKIGRTSLYPKDVFNHLEGELDKSIFMASKREQVILDEFKTRSLPFLDFKPDNEWEWLALAQHHGLPTRLMDWTTNPLVATYFALKGWKNHDSDAAIYFLENNDFVFAKVLPETEPYSLNTIRTYKPKHLNNRIVAQAGLFTVHDRPWISFEGDQLTQVIIPRELMEDINRMLEIYGINDSTMFPGLDGISNHIINKRGLLDTIAATTKDANMAGQT